MRRIKAEVDWDREIGAVTRRMLEKKGPALLFENIKGYTDGRCNKLFVSGLGARSRLALALGFSARCLQPRTRPVRHEEKPRDHSAGDGRHRAGERRHRPRRSDIDQTEFPVPKWHYLEGGRYIHTFTSIVTKDPDTGVMNVGLYRGMIGKKDTSPFLLIKGRPALGRAFRQMGGARPADAGRLRDRLGSDHVVSVRLAAAGRRLRI